MNEIYNLWLTLIRLAEAPKTQTKYILGEMFSVFHARRSFVSFDFIAHFIFDIIDTYTNTHPENRINVQRGKTENRKKTFSRWKMKRNRKIFAKMKHRRVKRTRCTRATATATAKAKPKANKWNGIYLAVNEWCLWLWNESSGFCTNLLPSIQCIRDLRCRLNIAYGYKKLIEWKRREEEKKIPSGNEE